MQSLDFLVMRIGSNSFPPPLYTHGSLPFCAHAFVNPVCGWKGKIRVVLGPISEPYPASFFFVPNATIIICLSGTNPVCCKEEALLA
jgi:hypothetical protein